MSNLKVGDTVNRYFCSVVMPLKVTCITPTRIVCHLWEFDPVTGIEIDEYMPIPISYIDLEPVNVS